MAEQSFLNKLGMRLGILGSAASLAIAAPIAAGDYSTTAHTAANRTGMFFDQTASAEKIGFVVGAVSGISFDHVSTVATIRNNQNTVALPAPQTPADTLIHIGNVNGQTSRVFVDSFGAGISSVYTGRNARGTAAAPQASQAGDALVTLNGIGYGATGYGTVANAAFSLGANETWTDSTHSTKAILELTVTGSITRSTVWTYLPTATTVLNTDAATNSVSALFLINHATSGVPAVGFGSSITLQGYDDGASAQRLLANFSASWLDASSATRSSKLNLNITANAANLQVLSMTPTGSVFTCTDAVTAAVTTGLTISHTTSGTAAIGFGTALVLNGPDDGGTLRGMATIQSQWTNATAGARASSLKFAVQVAAVSTVGFTINPTTAFFTSGWPLTINDTTQATTASAAALIVVGGIATAKNICFTGTTGASLKIVTPTVNATVAVTLGSTGPTGSTAGAPQGWCLINVAGTDRYFPFW